MSGTTQNGYPIVDTGSPGLKDYPVPGVAGMHVTLINDPIASVLLYILGRWNTEVESIAPARGITGGFDMRPIGGLSGGDTSNHRSGTAVDILYDTEYPAWTNPDNPASTTGKVGLIRQIFSAVSGAARWGIDWGDEQHIELDQGAHAAGPALVSAILAGTLPNTPVSLTTRGGGAPGASTDPSTGVVASGSGLGDATQDSNGNPLPVAVTLPGITPIPLTGAAGVTTRNRLRGILVRGRSLHADLANRVTSATMSYSATQVGQMTLSLVDTPDGQLLRDGIFTLGTTVDFGDQHMEVRSLSVSNPGGAPRLQVLCRSQVIAVLRSPLQSGPATWNTVNLAQWVRDRCRESGARAVVQDLGVSYPISRQTGTSIETTWDVLMRQATVTGCWAYEADQTVYFGRPTWLVNRPGVKGWRISWKGQRSYSPNLTGMPTWAGSFDGSGSESLQFNLIGDEAHLIRPGELVELDGLGDMSGEWIVTSVNLDAVLGKPVPVACTRVVNPVPTAAGV